MCLLTQRVTEIENMRHKVIETRQEYFNHNENEVSKRWAFEEAVRCDCAAYFSLSEFTSGALSFF